MKHYGNVCVLVRLTCFLLRGHMVKPSALDFMSIYTSCFEHVSGNWGVFGFVTYFPEANGEVDFWFCNC